jgi:hypothetical protein
LFLTAVMLDLMKYIKNIQIQKKLKA